MTSIAQSISSSVLNHPNPILKVSKALAFLIPRAEITYDGSASRELHAAPPLNATSF